MERFHMTLRFRECLDQPGYFEADDLDRLRVWVQYLEIDEDITPRRWQSTTRVPLAWVVKWKNTYPFFQPKDWARQHLPQAQRRLLSRPPYYHIGDRVQLFDAAAQYIGVQKRQVYRVEQVYDHYAPAPASEVEGLAEYSTTEGCVYRLQGLSSLVSHRALYLDEPPPLERLFREDQDGDVRITSYTHTQRDAVCLGPRWEDRPCNGEWLQWWVVKYKPLYLCLTVEQAQCFLQQQGVLEAVSSLEHASLHMLSSEVESVRACTEDGRTLGTLWNRPWDQGLHFQQS